MLTIQLPLHNRAASVSLSSSQNLPPWLSRPDCRQRAVAGPSNINCRKWALESGMIPRTARRHAYQRAVVDSRSRQRDHETVLID